MAAFAFHEPAEKYFDIAKSLDIYATLFKEVNAYYVDEVEPQKLVRKSIDGMLESLDPYTDFIPEDEVESFRITTTGQYGGIGALMQESTRIITKVKNKFFRSLLFKFHNCLCNFARSTRGKVIEF